MSIRDRVDFSRIAPREGSREAAFEELCCQIARHSSDVPEGSRFVRYRGAGGDGGVECLWRLPNGEEWGWQAKYVFDLDRAMTQASESVESALRTHPALTRYMVCLPFDLTGPTNRRGRSEEERYEEHRLRWEAAAGRPFQVHLSTRTSLLDDLLTFDPNLGRLKYWFDETLLSEEWFRTQIGEAIAAAGPRYTSRLNVETPVMGALEALGSTDGWLRSVEQRLQSIQKASDDFERAVSSTSDSGWGAVFPERLRAQGEEAASSLKDACRELGALSELYRTNAGGDPGTLAESANGALAQLRQIHHELEADIDSKHGAGASHSVPFRQFQAEYLVSFPTANLQIAEHAISELEDLLSWARSPEAAAPAASGLLVLGGWGTGKTHAVCYASSRRARQGLRSVLLFGARFAPDHDPWENAKRLLGLDLALSRDELLSVLDAAGESSGKPLLVIIDGINETRPRTYWREHLPPFLSQASRYPWVKICLTCRSTYAGLCIPDGLPLASFSHEGFAGAEFNACQEFFAHYGLEPPVSPALQPEFSNPLFLKLMCEALRADGKTRMPEGCLGIGTAISAFLREKNSNYATQHGQRSAGPRYPERALKAFVAAAEASRSSSLSWEAASRAIAEELPSPEMADPMLDWLVGEDMLIADADPSGGDGEHLRISFERLGDHMVAERLIEHFDPGNAQASFREALGFLCGAEGPSGEHQGLVEALAIQLPERFGVELPDCLPPDPPKPPFVRAVATSLPWRDSRYLTDRTAELMEEALHLSGFSHEAFDAALSASLSASPVDAGWLHRILSARPMPHRDAFWCGYLYQGYEGRGPVARMLDTALEIDPSSVPEDTVQRWATVLLWFCAAADRRVRDVATKALVRITEPYAGHWAELVSRFSSVDDEYIFERCLAAAYGALLRTRDAAIERDVASAAFHEVFENPLRFQNASIRDYARAILELAAEDSALPGGIGPESYLPPYESDWPLVIPSEADIEGLEDSHEMFLLKNSCLSGDFNIYTLSRLHGFENTVSRAEQGRWIIRQAMDMGYSGSLHRNYDLFMTGKYGNGRGRPDWGERIGKKYQWIALSRLAARLSDNLPMERDPWYPELLRLPFTYDQGRDIDPSFLIRSHTESRRQPSWWCLAAYDHRAAEQVPDAEWARTHDDLPDPGTLIAQVDDPDGRHWLALEVHADWSTYDSKAERSGSWRDVWFQVRGYLVPTSSLDTCWQWLEQQHFMGRWMPEGANFHEGFAGEYPWGTMFSQYDDSYWGSGGRDNVPNEILPASATLTISDELGSYQRGSINMKLPARTFFQGERLSWDGISGYLDRSGQPVLRDPSVSEGGVPALLINPEWLFRFLEDNGLSIVWTVLGEKLLASDGGGGRRLEYSRAYRLGEEGLISSTPIINTEGPAGAQDNDDPVF